MNCEVSYLAEEFFHNICPCFDVVFIVFPSLGVIPRTKNEIVEIVAASEYYMRNKESKKNVDGKMSIKKEKFFSYLIYNIISLSKMAGKTNSGKIS